MNLKPIVTCAAASLIGLPALAQSVPSPAPSPAMSAPTAPLSQAPATPRAAMPGDVAPTDPTTTTTAPAPDPPRSETPGSRLPRSNLPQASLPQASLPQASLPQASLPQGSLPRSDPPREDLPALDPPRDPSPPRAEVASNDVAAVPSTPADLAPGARVMDPSGAELGQVVKVTEPKPKQHLQAFCILEQQGVTVALPVSSIVLAGGALTARETRAEVWGTP